MNTPVAFLVFNRPDVTARVFARIREARPPRLYVVADAPRPDRPGEAEQCRAVLDLVEAVDWDCELKVNRAEQNLGCARRVSSGLDWVFEHEEQAIILEDDCLPEPTFFSFCDTLLERYRTDTRIFQVSGNNFQFGEARTAHSYYYSYFPHISGWPTWRRAWRHFDFEMAAWPDVRDGHWLDDVIGDPLSVRYWTDIFEQTLAGRNNSWAYRWTFACWLNNALSVLPNHNLVSNIGFGEEATHTTKVSRVAEMPTQPMAAPLAHPPFMIRDTRADAHTARILFGRRWRTQVKRIIKQALHV